MKSISASIQQRSLWQEKCKNNTVTCLDMVPTHSTASPATAAEATMVAMVVLLSNAAATATAVGYAGNWSRGNAEDSVAIANAADWRAGNVKDSAAIAMQ